MVEVGMAAGVVVVGVGGVGLGIGTGLLLAAALALPTTADTATTMILTPMATGLHTAMVLMAMDIAAPIMATAAITRATDMQPITPIVVITIAMVGTTHIAGTPIVEQRH